MALIDDTPAPDDTSAHISDDLYLEIRDFRIKAVSLISSDGVFRDISRLVMELQVRQDMYLGFMSGDMLVTDGVDIHTTSALHGNEYIYLHLEEPSTKVVIKKAFRIYKVAERTTVLNSMTRYIIYFVSNELVSSNLKKVCKAYKGVTISEIARDVLTSYLGIPENKITIDETDQPVSCIIPNWRPAEALNWLCTRAFSSKNGGESCWFFYENLDGFQFRSIQSLYEEPHPCKVPFKFENKRIDKSFEMDKYAIDTFSSPRDFDVLDTSSSGGFGLKMVSLDPFHRTYNTTLLSTDDTKKLYKNEMYSNPLTDVGTPLYDSHDSLVLTVQDPSGAGAGEYPVLAKEWIKRLVSLSLLKSQMVDISIPGNLRVQAGSLVTLRFPYSVVPKDGENIWDLRKSGTYLCAAVNHKFDFINHKFQTLLLLSRDSTPTSLPSPDVNMPSKIKKINYST